MGRFHLAPGKRWASAGLAGPPVPLLAALPRPLACARGLYAPMELPGRLPLKAARGWYIGRGAVGGGAAAGVTGCVCAWPTLLALLGSLALS